MATINNRLFAKIVCPEDYYLDLTQTCMPCHFLCLPVYDTEKECRKNCPDYPKRHQTTTTGSGVAGPTTVPPSDGHYPIWGVLVASVCLLVIVLLLAAFLIAVYLRYKRKGKAVEDPEAHNTHSGDRRTSSVMPKDPCKKGQHPISEVMADILNHLKTCGVSFRKEAENTETEHSSQQLLKRDSRSSMGGNFNRNNLLIGIQNRDGFFPDENYVDLKKEKQKLNSTVHSPQLGSRTALDQTSGGDTNRIATSAASTRVAHSNGGRPLPRATKGDASKPDQYSHVKSNPDSRPPSSNQASDMLKFDLEDAIEKSQQLDPTAKHTLGSTLEGDFRYRQKPGINYKASADLANHIISSWEQTKDTPSVKRVSHERVLTGRNTGTKMQRSLTSGQPKAPGRTGFVLEGAEAIAMGNHSLCPGSVVRRQDPRFEQSLRSQRSVTSGIEIDLVDDSGQELLRLVSIDRGSLFASESYQSDHWNSIMNLYQRLEACKHKFPWITGCMISNDHIEVVVSLKGAGCAIGEAYQQLCGEISTDKEEFLVMTSQEEEEV